MITLKEANATLTQVAEVCGLPFTAIEHRDLTATNYVTVGDCPVRGAKHRGRWLVRQDDVRVAADSLHRAAGAGGSPLVLTPWPEEEECPFGTWSDTFRHYLMYAAWNLAEDPAYQPRRNGRATPHQVRLLAYTRPDYSSASVPQGVADMLDRGDVLADGHGQEAARCVGCGAVGQWSLREPDNVWSWRRPTPSGYITRCHPCERAAAASLLQYGGEYRGRQYADMRRAPGTVPARSYACTVCGACAVHWDHCHVHGEVRGPLCVSCNQRFKLSIGDDAWSAWWAPKLERAGESAEARALVSHLTQCTGCP
ncbi:endonuclease domain-containing protein [Streptomyces sp. DT199]|uniref:endonuclease domain-containing protein n=1 Tax=Streptomyces sp. DT199 TaxID=3393421 RepID=UPI003CF1A2CA